jgi:hypothetical protein
LGTLTPALDAAQKGWAADMCGDERLGRKDLHVQVVLERLRENLADSGFGVWALAERLGAHTPNLFT